MKTGFILHLDSLSVLDELTHEQAGILFKAIRDYNLGKEPELDFAMRMAFIPFKNQFERDLEKYNNTCERNKNNGAKGGRPKKPKETQETQVVFEKPKKADNDNDNKNDNNNDNIIVPFQERVNKFLNWFNLEFTKHGKPQTKFRTLNNQTENNLKKLLDKYTTDEWSLAFENMINNTWVIENKNATPDHFLRLANFEKYLNQVKLQETKTAKNTFAWNR
jgi:hypothetical protein